MLYVQLHPNNWICMKKNDVNMEIFFAEALVKLQVLEKLLISKNVFTKEEYEDAAEEVTAKIAKILLEKANVPGDLDEMINDLKHKKGPAN